MKRRDRKVLFINSIVPCNLVVNAEYDGIPFTGQLSDPERTLLSLNANVGDIDDLIHAEHRIRKQNGNTVDLPTALRHRCTKWVNVGRRPAWYFWRFDSYTFPSSLEAPSLNGCVAGWRGAASLRMKRPLCALRWSRYGQRDRAPCRSDPRRIYR
jgi:hypothetical protein